MKNKKIILSGAGTVQLIQDSCAFSSVPLLQVAACGICATDRKGFFAPPASMKLPLVPGHEFCGIHVATGRRVVVWPAISCGHCSLCRRGKVNLCKELKLFGLHCDGGYQLQFTLSHSLAEKVVLLEIPSCLSWTQATMTEPLACVIHSFAMVQDIPETICIYGAGLMGRLAARLVHHKWPHCQIEILDPDPIRQKLADEMYLEGGVDCVFMACTSETAVSTALKRLKPGGEMLMFSGLERHLNPISIDYNQIHRMEQTLRGTYGCLPEDMVQALELMAAGTVVVDDLITGVIPLERVPESLAKIGNPYEFKTVIQFD